MGKRRKSRFSAAAKAKASGKGKTPKQPEEDCDEKDGCSESLETDAKKQKLGIETNEKESAPQTGKYVPPFTASQRVVKSSRLRDKLCLNKTGLNSQENSPQFTDTSNTQEKAEETMNDDSSKEGHETSPENSEKNEEIITLNKEKDHGMDDSIAHDIAEEYLPSADVSMNSSKDEVESKKGKNTAKTSVPVEDIPDEDLGNSSTPAAVPEENLVEPNQTIDDKEIIIDAKINDAENQEHDVFKPADTVNLSVENTVNDDMKFVAEVPKLSELIKRSYVIIGEDEKLEKTKATDDLTNHAADISSERAENAEHVKSQKESVDIAVDNENLNDSKSNTIDNENLQIYSQTDNENQTNEVAPLVENDCEVTENAEVKESTEKASTDLCKNDVENNNEKSSATITGHNKQTNEQNDDQKVPDEMLEKSLAPKPEMVVADKMEVGLDLSPIPKETTERCLRDESNCENPHDVTVSTSASSVTVDDLSFAKEFEAIEELFDPIDDMGLFDDVIDDQLKSVSFEEQMPKGDSTMEFLINEIASLNCMVANYQKAAEEMKRHYKISCPY